MCPIFISPSGVPEFLLVGNMISLMFFFYGTAKTAAEAGVAVDSISSDLEKKFRFHSDKRAEGEGEETQFYLLPFYSSEMRRLFLVKDSSVENFDGT